MKRNGNAERRRRENRGGEVESRIEAPKSPRGAGFGEGVSSSLVGEGLGGGRAPSPENFLSGNGAFWCIRGACFNVSIRRIKQSRLDAGI